MLIKESGHLHRVTAFVPPPLPPHGLRPPKHMYFTSRYSSTPYLEPSRPMPDSFTPPNVASGVDSSPSLTPTIPTSNASATRQI